MALAIPFSNPATYVGHSGVDFAQPRGTRFRASGPGVVEGRWSNARGGNLFGVKYDGYPSVFYAHLDSYADVPAPGTRVNEGDIIGRVGNTGNSTGPHLHMEVEGYATTAGFWRFFDRNRVVGGGGGWTGGVPAQLAVDGEWGPATTAKLQSVLGVTVDGELGPQTISALQSRLGVTADGVMGPQTISALQAKVSATVDGQLGPQTVSMLQTYLNNGGTFAATPADGKLVVDGEWGTATTIAFQKSLAVLPDGELGPITWTAFQNAVGVPADGIPGPVTFRALQQNVGATVDGELGPETVRKLQEHLNAGKGWSKVTPPPTEPEPEVPGDTEESHTPNVVTPTAADFPAWIRYEERPDYPDYTAKPTLNKDAAKHYGREYNPIESHTHWWYEPGKGGTHDGNVTYIGSKVDLSVNYVVSENRITLMVPLNKIALTTGSRNPYAWKSENDPTLTEQQYKTMGYLHYIVEKKNPSLLNEPIRLHKEFYATSCSEIDVAKVRHYAEQFRTGALDPATGLPPTTGPDPEPDAKAEILEHLEAIARLVDEL